MIDIQTALDGKTNSLVNIAMASPISFTATLVISASIATRYFFGGFSDWWHYFTWKPILVLRFVIVNLTASTMKTKSTV